MVIFFRQIDTSSFSSCDSIDPVSAHSVHTPNITENRNLTQETIIKIRLKSSGVARKFFENVAVNTIIVVDSVITCFVVSRAKSNDSLFCSFMDTYSGKLAK